MEDYAWRAATYVVACPKNRTCQVGMGPKLFGEARGERLRFSGELECRVIGLGAVHIRPVDGLGACQVGLTPKRQKPLSWTWESK